MAELKRKKPAGDDGDEAFPRGGSDGLTLLERRRIEMDARASVEEEFAAGGGAPLVAQQKGAKRVRKTTDASGEDNEETIFKNAASRSGQVKTVEFLKIKNLSIGSRVWGAVLDISARGLSISLPNGLRGYVAANEASDVLAQMYDPASKAGAALRLTAGEAGVPPLTSLFSIGQYVRCIVLALGGDAAADAAPAVEGGDASAAKAGGGGKIDLSLQLRRVCASLTAESLYEGAAVPAVVRSVEDHGYVLSFGVKGVSGFLRKKEHQASYGAGATLVPGALIEVVVTQAAGSAAAAASRHGILVSSASADAACAVTKEVAGLNLLSLLPGSMVNARVRTVLPNGLLVSFLTYFQGTIDVFHAGLPTPGLTLKELYMAGQKLRARILFINVAEKRVGLSVLPHLQMLTLPSPTPMLGQLFEAAVVKRIDTGRGLLLELPMSPVPCGAHVSITNAVGTERVEDLNTRFKIGQVVAARVIGYRLLDGLASVSLRPEALTRVMLTYRDMVVGMPLDATVLSIEEYGLLVEVARGVRALVPITHMTELGTAKGKAKFKVGQKVSGRCLSIVESTKRMTMTLKKGLLGSKLPIIASLDVPVGSRAHGVVDGSSSYGVFVKFYNNIHGLLHIKELSLTVGQKPSDLYTAGQVVKVRVSGVDQRSGRLSLGLASVKGAEAVEAGAAAAAAPSGDFLGDLQAGDLVDGTVEKVQEQSDGRVILHLKVDGATARGVSARMELYHLSDHPGALDALRKVITPGAKIGQLLVLQRHEAQRVLRVTRKASLIEAAKGTPSDFEMVKATAMLSGFVSNVTSDAVYVRFLGGLTGRAGLGQIADTFVTTPALHFSEGQSVKCQVVSVDAEKRRFSLSLTAKVAASTDAGYLHALLRDLEFAEQLRCERDSEPFEAWPAALTPGSMTSATVSKVEPYGAVCDIKGHEDFVGIIALTQTADAADSALGATPKTTSSPLTPGQELQPRVLDISRADGVVELSLRPEVLSVATAQAGAAPAKAKAGKKAAKAAKEEPVAAVARAAKVGQKCEALVVAVKPYYVMVVLPKLGGALAFAATQDFNLPSPDNVRRRFAVGDRVQASVQVLPCASTCGRLLVHVDLSQSSPQFVSVDGKKHGLGPGALLNVVVVAVHPTHLDVTLGKALTGSVHISHAMDFDPAALPQANPLDQYKAGQKLECVLLATPHGVTSAEGAHVAGSLDLSLRPSVLKAARAALEAGSPAAPEAPHAVLSSLLVGQPVVTFVHEVEDDCVWMSLGPHLRGRVSVLHSSDDPDALAAFGPESFQLGAVHVVTVQKVKLSSRVLELSLLHGTSAAAPAPPANLAAKAGNTREEAPVAAGQLVMGRIAHISGGGVVIHMGWGRSGRVALSDLHDFYVPNALEGIDVGQYVRCRVLSTVVSRTEGKSESKSELSLRPSQGGKVAGLAPRTKAAGPAAPRELLDAAQLVEGAPLKGYVRHVDSKGMFVEVDRSRVARVQLRNLADGFIETPSALFPMGALVEGRVIVPPGTAVGGRIELTLRSGKVETVGRSRGDISSLAEGMFCDAKVRRIEAFGVFCDLIASGVSGLCHVSEIADGPVREIAKLFKEGQAVRVKVLKIVAESQKVSLGMKPSYFAGQEDAGGDGTAAVGGWRRGSSGGGEDGDDIDAEMADMVDAAGGSDDDDEDDEEASGSGADEQVDVDDEAAASSQGDEDSDLDMDDEEGMPSRSRPGGTSSGPMDVDPAPPSWGGLQLTEDQAGGAAVQEADEDEEEGGGGAKAKKSKNAKKREKEEKEREIRAAEKARLSGDAAPKSAVDFERLLVASPNSSFVWIQYMAFLISLGDVDKARTTAEKALATIHFRDEGEKLNVWVAWLNLEAAYGSPDPTAALATLFARALQYNDQKKLYFALLGICNRTDRTELRDQTLRAMCKKFATSAKVWLRALEARLGGDDADGARKLLDRAVAALPTRKHIKVITQSALLEFRLGSAERGRGVLEGVLRNYPKRLDLWSLYLDQEIKLGDAPRTRALFERATHLALPPKKMKLLFRRFLEYEKTHGDAASVEHVKRRAMEFVASAP